jgi:hypothetical protein
VVFLSVVNHAVLRVADAAMNKLRWTIPAVLISLALAGCSSSETTTNPENGLSAREETCGGNRSYMESVPECLHMTPAEKGKAEHFAHDKQVEGEAKEAESVLKKREAERTANAIKGSG